MKTLFAVLLILGFATPAIAQEGDSAPTARVVKKSHKKFGHKKPKKKKHAKKSHKKSAAAPMNESVEPSVPSESNQ